MTLLEMTILGIVAEGGCHAYQVEKVIERRRIRERLTIGFSTIYSTMKKLEKKGFLESTYKAQESLPGRRIYTITYKGKQCIIDEIKRVLSQPQRSPSPFEAGLSLGSLLNTADLKESLSLYEAELGRLIQTKVKEITRLNTKDPLERALLTRPLSMWQTERKWVRELLALI